MPSLDRLQVVLGPSPWTFGRLSVAASEPVSRPDLLVPLSRRFLIWASCPFRWSFQLRLLWVPSWNRKSKLG